MAKLGSRQREVLEALARGEEMAWTDTRFRGFNFGSIAGKSVSEAVCRSLLRNRWITRVLRNPPSTWSCTITDEGRAALGNQPAETPGESAHA